jgi:hypothetical protein
MKKYSTEEINEIRRLFDQDVDDWAETKKQRDLDIQCLSTDQGPWPDAEWNARHVKGAERPCLHENVITQFEDIAINQIDMNPMGISTQPAGSGATPQTAEQLEGRIRQIEYEEAASGPRLTAAKNAIEGSYGFYFWETAYAGKFRQKLVIREVQDPNTVVPSFAKKRDWSDLRRAWEIDRMTREEFKERYPKAVLQSFDSYQDSAPRWIDDNTIQVAAYWHFQEDERELLEVDGMEGRVNVYADEFEDGTKSFEGRITNRRKVKEKKVLKTIFNGVEALDEIEWIDPGDIDYGIDPEIPLYVVTGRVRYENGVRTIESMTRRARVGQLLYDYVISQGQELMALAPRTARIGPEGTFDTSTNWNPRANQAYREYKPVVDPTSGQPLPPPAIEQYDIAGYQFIEMAKMSCLQGIQNAIGMASVDHKDAVAKSGKALDAIQQDMAIGTAHYFGSLKLSQEREYRMMQRIIPLLDEEGMEVAIRDRFGKHQMATITADTYKGRFAVAVGTGKLYQTLQDKQEQASEDLMKINDPQVLIAVLPGALRLRGLGDYGDELAAMLETLQPMPMQQARMNKGQADPMVQQVKAMAQQQIQQLQQAVQQLQQERQAESLKLQSNERINQQNNATKLQIAEINASVKERMDTLDQQIEYIKHISDVLTEKVGLTHEAVQNAMDRMHEHAITDKDNAAAAQQQQMQLVAAAQQQQNQQETPANA